MGRPKGSKNKKRSEAVKAVEKETVDIKTDEKKKINWDEPKENVLKDPDPMEDSNFMLREKIAEQTYEREKDDLTPLVYLEDKEDEDTEEVSEDKSDSSPEDDEALDATSSEEDEEDIEEEKKAEEEQPKSEPLLKELLDYIKKQDERIAKIEAAKPQKQATVPKPVTKKELDRAKIVSVAERLNYGEKEDTVQALVEFAEELRGSGSEQDVEATFEQLYAKKKMIDQFYAPEEHGGFGELAKDNKFAYLVSAEAEKLAQERGCGYSWELYKEAGETIKSWLSSGFNRKPAVEKKTLEEKREKKKEIDVVKGLNEKAKQKETEEKNPTDKEWIEFLNKKRGFSY